MDAAMTDVEYQITIDSCQDHGVRHFRQNVAGCLKHGITGV